MRSPILDQLHSLDPARGRTGSPAAAEDPQLLTILAGPRAGKTGLRLRSRRRGPVRVLIAAAAVVVVAAVVLAGMLGLGPGGTPPAFASWTAAPVDLSSEQVAQRVAHCPNSYPETGSSPLSPALTDVRGQFTFVIFTDNHVLVQCYLQTSADGAVLAGTAQAGPVSNEPVISGITTVSDGVTTWSFGPSGGGAIALAYGRAAPDVAAVTATISDGQVVTATVQGGWWAMWTPGDTPLPHKVTVIYTDGSETVAAIGQPN